MASSAIATHQASSVYTGARSVDASHADRDDSGENHLVMMTLVWSELSLSLLIDLLAILDEIKALHSEHTWTLSILAVQIALALLIIANTRRKHARFA